MTIQDTALSRRQVLAGTGALIVGFSLDRGFAQQPAQLPGSLRGAPFLDSWIRIDADGRVTVFTGKAELGQGIKTALAQVAAEELNVDPRGIAVVTADTARTANEGYTAGSQSMPNSATAVMHAAAQVRGILIAQASKRLDLPPERLKAQEGAIVSEDGRRVGFGELVADEVLHVRAEPRSKLTDPTAHAVMGRSLRRVDIPAKMTGGASYVQDLRLPGMAHGRIVRPPSYGATLTSVDAGTERMPGVIKVVRDGNFLAVIAEREYQAVLAMRALAAAAKWNEDASSLPDPAAIHAHLQGLPDEPSTIQDVTGAANPAQKTLEATYRRPYQMHGSIGPSCAVARLDGDALTVWSHGQGMFPMRAALADLLKMPAEKIHCIHVEGSGCYGHNGADDAGADAALLARALPGRPVRVQWMREHEHMWEPFGPAMTTSAKASLDAAGAIVGWDYHVWSNTHSMRPGGAGHLLAGRHRAAPAPAPKPEPIPLPDGGGDRNAIPLYKFPNAKVVHHFISGMPLRVSALRGLGAYMNVFSIESFMDELARAAGADPVEFRLRHLDDPRAKEVVKLAAEKFGWSNATLSTGRGRGFAFARYKNHAAYTAIAMEVSVDRDSGDVRVMRVVAATDSGDAVNPDGIRNQIEGGIVQSSSWTLYEQVRFDRRRVLSRDWSGYPIMRFSAVPESIDVHVISRPGQPFLGTGEAAQGPASAAIANAVADATGVRIRDLPLDRERVKAALGA